jgi:hypothetical protein
MIFDTKYHLRGPIWMIQGQILCAVKYIGCATQQQVRIGCHGILACLPLKVQLIVSLIQLDRRLYGGWDSPFQIPICHRCKLSSHRSLCDENVSENWKMQAIRYTFYLTLCGGEINDSSSWNDYMHLLKKPRDLWILIWLSKIQCLQKVFIPLD